MYETFLFPLTLALSPEGRGDFREDNGRKSFLIFTVMVYSQDSPFFTLQLRCYSNGEQVNGRVLR
jgi:hypothetical protein